MTTMTDQDQPFIVVDQRDRVFTVEEAIIDKHSEALGVYGIAVYAVLARRVNNDASKTETSAYEVIACH